MVRVLLDGRELGVPFDRDAELAQLLAHDQLVIVLAKHQDERKRAQVLADVTDRNACGPAPVCPYIAAGGAGTQRECLIDDAHLGIDFHRARLHRHRTRLLRRAGMAIDDARLHAAPGKLVGEHQAGRAGADDENVDIHRCISLRHVSHGHHPCGFRKGRSRLRRDKNRDLAYTSTAFPMLTGTLVTIVGRSALQVAA